MKFPFHVDVVERLYEIREEYEGSNEEYEIGGGIDEKTAL